MKRTFQKWDDFTMFCNKVKIVLDRKTNVEGTLWQNTEYAGEYEVDTRSKDKAVNATILKKFIPAGDLHYFN